MDRKNEDVSLVLWPKSDVQWPKKLFAICMVLMLLSCVGASLLQTSFGDVQVTKFKIPISNGQWITGQLFKPKAANENNKVPIVIAAHGYLNNNRMQDSAAIELSRRGIAVISFDLIFHGESSSSPFGAGAIEEITGKTAWGVIPMVEYAYNNLDYIDKTKIGVMGHSGGSMAVQMATINYGAQYYGALQSAQAADSDGGTTITASEQEAANAVDKISAAWITSFAKLASPEMMLPIHANFGFDFSRYDEGGYENRNGNADLYGGAPESLAIVNSIFPENQKLKQVELEKYYGDASKKTLRVVYNPRETHITMPISKTSTGYGIDFFVKSFQMTNPISLEQQIWNWKEFFNFLGLISSFLVIIPMVVFLLKLPFFSSINRPEPKALPVLKGVKYKGIFWGTWMASWLVSWLSFMPITNLDQLFFPNGPKMMQLGNLFTQPATNFIVLWAVFNGLVGFVLFWISFNFVGRKNGASIETLGIRIKGKELFTTFILSVCIFIGFYAQLMFAQFFFNTDFRIWLIAITPFNGHAFMTALPYLPLFFVFFFSNSMLQNSAMRVEGQKNWVHILIGAIGNVLGLVIIIIIQYGTLFATGVIHYNTLGTDWLHIVVAIPLVILLFVSNYISRYLFKATGKVWLGSMVNTMILVMIFVANTATLSAF